MSYIYTKTSWRFWIKTPQEILLKIKEMESLSPNIESRTFILPSELGFESYYGSCLLSTIKCSSFLVFTSCHNFSLTLCFHFWFRNFSLKFLENFLGILKLLSSSVSKLLWYLPRFIRGFLIFRFIPNIIYLTYTVLDFRSIYNFYIFRPDIV